jgi:N-acetylmuramoyl-L-alanine amidase
MVNSSPLFHPFRPTVLRCLGLSVLLSTGVGWIPAALAQTPSPHAPANPTVNGGRIVRPILRLGSQGESVRELQSMLILLGYYTGAVSGVYQEDTALAVQRFQQAASITADGIVGPATWSKLLPAPAAAVTPPGQPVAANPSPSHPPATSMPPRPTTPTATTPSTTPSTRPTTTSNPSPPSTAVTLPILRPGMEGEAVRFLQQRLRAKQVYRGPVSGFFGPQTETAVRQLQQTNNLLVDGIVGPATWNALN